METLIISKSKRMLVWMAAGAIFSVLYVITAGYPSEEHPLGEYMRGKDIFAYYGFLVSAVLTTAKALYEIFHIWIRKSKLTLNKTGFKDEISEHRLGSVGWGDISRITVLRGPFGGALRIYPKRDSLIVRQIVETHGYLEINEVQLPDQTVSTIKRFFPEVMEVKRQRKG